MARADMRDAGRYTCEALNQAGRSEKHYDLNVWGEASLSQVGSPMPAGWIPMPQGGRGSATLIKSHGTIPLPISPTPSLVPPVFPAREPPTLTVTEGHPARLSCECRGVPFPKISWKKDGKIAAPVCSHIHCSPQGAGLEMGGLRGQGVGITEVSFLSTILCPAPEPIVFPAQSCPASENWNHLGVTLQVSLLPASLS